ncbi:hypothetical protein PG989_005674 [Apiospora arundinis]
MGRFRFVLAHLLWIASIVAASGGPESEQPLRVGLAKVEGRRRGGRDVLGGGGCRRYRALYHKTARECEDCYEGHKVEC